MMDPRAFWRYVDERTAPGTLLVVLFESWKRIADYVGIDAVDLGAKVFQGICSLATSGADAQAPLSVNVFGAVWISPEADQHAIGVLSRWLPLRIASPSATFEVACSWSVVPWVAGQSGREIYEAARAALVARMNALPHGERYPTLPEGWSG